MDRVTRWQAAAIVGALGAAVAAQVAWGAWRSAKMAAEEKRAATAFAAEHANDPPAEPKRSAVERPQPSWAFTLRDVVDHPRHSKPTRVTDGDPATLEYAVPDVGAVTLYLHPRGWELLAQVELDALRTTEPPEPVARAGAVRWWAIRSGLFAGEFASRWADGPLSIVSADRACPPALPSAAFREACRRVGR